MDYGQPYNGYINGPLNNMLHVLLFTMIGSAVTLLVSQELRIIRHFISVLSGQIRSLGAIWSDLASTIASTLSLFKESSSKLRPEKKYTD